MKTKLSITAVVIGLIFLGFLGFFQTHKQSPPVVTMSDYQKGQQKMIGAILYAIEEGKHYKTDDASRHAARHTEWESLGVFFEKISDAYAPLQKSKIRKLISEGPDNLSARTAQQQIAVAKKLNKLI